MLRKVFVCITLLTMSLPAMAESVVVCGMHAKDFDDQIPLMTMAEQHTEVNQAIPAWSNKLLFCSLDGIKWDAHAQEIKVMLAWQKHWQGFDMNFRGGVNLTLEDEYLFLGAAVSRAFALGPLKVTPHVGFRFDKAVAGETVTIAETKVLVSLDTGTPLTLTLEPKLTCGLSGDCDFTVPLNATLPLEGDTRLSLGLGWSEPAAGESSATVQARFNMKF